MDHYNYYEDKMEEFALKEKKIVKLSKLWLIIIGFLAASIVFNIFLKIRLTRVVEAKNAELLKTEKEIAEKLQVLKEFDAAKNNLQNLNNQKDELDKLITLKTSALENSENQNKILAKQIENIPDLKNEIADLKSERKKLYSQIAEMEQGDELTRQAFIDLQENYSGLPNDIKEKIEKSGHLKAYNIIVTPLRLHSGGKQVPTFKARKTHHFDITFDLIENVFAIPGEKHITATLISQGAQITYRRGISSEIIGSQTVNYDNSETQVNIRIDNTHKLGKGLYAITLLADNIPLATKKFELK
ncbi:MAG TPA: hypothetical protein VJY62_16175 [Bacteroidia bacterium]|nr:hypothetical protein [Bacteroidia bacterium]